MCTICCSHFSFVAGRFSTHFLSADNKKKLNDEQKEISFEHFVKETAYAFENPHKWKIANNTKIIIPESDLTEEEIDEYIRGYFGEEDRKI